MFKINFLEHHRKQVTKQQQFDLLLWRIALGVVGGAVVIALVTVGVNFWLQLQLKQLQDRQADLEKAVLFQEDAEKSILILEKKLSLIGDLLDQRKDKNDVISYFNTLFGPEVLLKDIAYEAEDKAVTLNLEGASIFVFDRVLQILESDQTKQKFTQLNTSEVKRNDSGKYGVTLTVIFADSTADNAAKK